jgi:hypothetical protein
MQSPPSISEQAPPRLESARLVIETALMEGRKVLNEMESKAVLAAFRIPIAQTVVARSASEAMVLAEELGLPVVMKIDSPQIVHKADSGGVRLNLNSLAAVRDAWLEIMDEVKKNRPDAHINGIAIEPMIQKPNGRELVVGMVRDKIFGPTIVFGPGGAGVDPQQRPRRGPAAAQPGAGRRHAGLDPHHGAARRVPQHAAGQHEGDRSRAAECLGHGLRIAVDQRDGHQPADRGRERRGRRRCAHHHRQPADHAGPLRPHGDPPLSVAPADQLSGQGRHPGDDPSDQARGRAHRAGLRAQPVGRVALPALHEHHPRVSPAQWCA